MDWKVFFINLHGALVDSVDIANRTPLLIAAYGGKNSVFSLLIKHGAQVNSGGNENRNPLTFATIRVLY